MVRPVCGRHWAVGRHPPAVLNAVGLPRGSGLQHSHHRPSLLHKWRCSANGPQGQHSKEGAVSSSSNNKTLEALDSLLGRAATPGGPGQQARSKPPLPAEQQLGARSPPASASASLDADEEGAPQQQQEQLSPASRFLLWADIAFKSAWGGPLAIPELQAQANATLSMPKMQPYMAYLLCIAHVVSYAGIQAADLIWGPGSSGDLTMALSNDHLAVQSGGELWRLVLCTFVHGSPINLAVTLAVLLLLAADLEKSVGLWIFAATVSLATISGTVCDLLLNDLPVTQGATPAIAATVGALVVEERKNFLFYEKVENAREQQRRQHQWRLESAAAIRAARRSPEPWEGYEQGYSSTRRTDFLTASISSLSSISSLDDSGSKGSSPSGSLDGGAGSGPSSSSSSSMSSRKSQGVAAEDAEARVRSQGGVSSSSGGGGVSGVSGGSVSDTGGGITITSGELTSEGLASGVSVSSALLSRPRNRVVLLEGGSGSAGSPSSSGSGSAPSMGAGAAVLERPQGGVPSSRSGSLVGPNVSNGNAAQAGSSVSSGVSSSGDGGAAVRGSGGTQAGAGSLGVRSPSVGNAAQPVAQPGDVSVMPAQAISSSGGGSVGSGAAAMGFSDTQGGGVPQQASTVASSSAGSSAVASTTTNSSSSSSNASEQQGSTAPAPPRMEAWEGYEQGYSTSTGAASAADDVMLLSQMRPRGGRRRRRYIEPPPPKEGRQEVATVEVLEGLFKFSGIVSSENKAWLYVAGTLFSIVDAIQNLISTDDVTISVAGVAGAFFAGIIISLGLSPQYTVVLEPVPASSGSAGTAGAPTLTPEQRAAANLPASSMAGSVAGSLGSMDSMSSLRSLDAEDGALTQVEDRWVWGMTVKDKVPATQRFLTVTTALALLSYVMYELLL